MCFCAPVLPFTIIYKRLYCDRYCFSCVSAECNFIEFLARDDVLQLCCCVGRHRVYAMYDFLFHEEWVETVVPVGIVME